MNSHQQTLIISPTKRVKTITVGVNSEASPAFSTTPRKSQFTFTTTSHKQLDLPTSVKRSFLSETDLHNNEFPQTPRGFKNLVDDSQNQFILKTLDTCYQIYRCLIRKLLARQFAETSWSGSEEFYFKPISSFNGSQQ